MSMPTVFVSHGSPTLILGAVFLWLGVSRLKH